MEQQRRKKKILLALQEASLWKGSGIAEYERNMAIGLSRIKQYALRGVVFRCHLNEMPFKVIRHFLPERYFFNDGFLQRLCPIPFNVAVGVCAPDVSVFFANRLPKLGLKGKVLGVLHDLIPLRMMDYMVREGISEERIAMMRSDYEDLVSRSDVVCTVSEYSKTDIIKEFGVNPNKIKIVPPGVDNPIFSRALPYDNEVRMKYRLPARYILYFGGQREYKNVAAALRGYAMLPRDIRSQVSFVSSGRSDSLMSLAEKLGVCDGVLAGERSDC